MRSLVNEFCNLYCSLQSIDWTTDAEIICMTGDDYDSSERKEIYITEHVTMCIVIIHLYMRN